MINKIISIQKKSDEIKNIEEDLINESNKIFNGLFKSIKILGDKAHIRFAIPNLMSEYVINIDILTRVAKEWANPDREYTDYMDFFDLTGVLPGETYAYPVSLHITKSIKEDYMLRFLKYIGYDTKYSHINNDVLITFQNIYADNDVSSGFCVLSYKDYTSFHKLGYYDCGENLILFKALASIRFDHTTDIYFHNKNGDVFIRQSKSDEIPSGYTYMKKEDIIKLFTTC